jgi:1-acyl-sn-glycerol-3-phosphate acyltransferase
MIYRFFHFFFNLLFRTFFGYRISGKNHLPSRGPFIICANHTSWFDPPLTGCIVPAKNRVHFMAKEELFHILFLGWIIKKNGGLSGPAEHGRPQGHTPGPADFRSRRGCGVIPGRHQDKNRGVGKAHAGCRPYCREKSKPVVPVAIKWPPGLFKRIQVAIGEPVVFQGKRKGSLEEVSGQIMEEIRKQWVSLTP